jgi:hypothetical protein
MSPIRHLNNFDLNFSLGHLRVFRDNPVEYVLIQKKNFRRLSGLLLIFHKNCYSCCQTCFSGFLYSNIAVTEIIFAISAK